MQGLCVLDFLADKPVLNMSLQTDFVTKSIIWLSMVSLLDIVAIGIRRGILCYKQSQLTLTDVLVFHLFERLDNRNTCIDLGLSKYIFYANIFAVRNVRLV